MNSDNIFDASTGERIRYLRQQIGISLEQLADMLEIPLLMMKKYETDLLPLPMELAAKAAKVLHTTPGYLLCWEAALFDVNQQMVDEETLLAEFENTGNESIDLFFEMTYKSPEEKDEIISTGAFHKHIEGYLIYTLREMGYSETAITNARKILNDDVFQKFTSEAARKAGESCSCVSENRNTTSKIYQFPSNKHEPW